MRNRGLTLFLDSQACLTVTVWKFQKFSITQNLREINFGDSRSAKTAVFALLGAVKFVHLVNIRLQKVQEFMKIKIQSLEKC